MIQPGSGLSELDQRNTLATAIAPSAPASSFLIQLPPPEYCEECADLAVYWPDADSAGRWLVWQHVSGCPVTSAAVQLGREQVEEMKNG